METGVAGYFVKMMPLSYVDSPGKIDDPNTLFCCGFGGDAAMIRSAVFEVT